MGKLIVTEFVSIDGVMEAPGGEEGYRHTNWTFEFPDEGQYDYKLEELRESEALLLGRVTYEGFAAAWPERTDEAGFADKFNSMPKYVVSSTLRDPEWNNTTVLEGDFTESVPRLKDQVEGNVVVHGSNMLVHGLLEHDLVDELRLMIFPVILGVGKDIFPSLDDKIVWDLVDHRQYGSVVVHAYRRPGR
ncbi:MAG TPA: dihydrofolate reductase family protein [Gaiellaceae bacterium]|nr:dihydrofolate reductase family protein [Gaiellaceae bacterium]